MSSRRGDDNSALARLAAALHPSDPHPDRVLAASESCVLEIVELARRHRVSALLSWSLERGGRLDSLPAAARTALRKDALDVEFHRAGLAAVLSRAAAALDAAQRPFLALKGAALGGLVYPAPHLRPITDVDILVPSADLQAALRTLQAAGFEPPSARDRNSGATSTSICLSGLPSPGAARSTSTGPCPSRPVTGPTSRLCSPARKPSTSRAVACSRSAPRT